MRKSLVAATLLFGTLTLAACNPTLRTHGYVPTEDAKPQQINPNTDTKATVLASLGSPSIEGTFDEVVLAGINQWQFEPAQYQGKSVRAWAKQRIRFDLS